MLQIYEAYPHPATPDYDYRISIDNVTSDSVSYCVNHAIASYINQHAAPVYRYVINHAYQTPGIWGPK